MQKIPVHIISGFLGSGKTTAIIFLLEQKKPEERWAIVINEFGKISIDGQTFRERSSAGSVFDISGGCICCSARLYLKDNIEKIVRPGCFDRLLIEPSGLGGTDTVAEIVSAFPELQLMPVICMVDIRQVENPRLRQNMLYQAQIRKSQRIVFSKCYLHETPEEACRLMKSFQQEFPDKESYLKSSQLSLSILESGAMEEIQPSPSEITVVNVHLKDDVYRENTFTQPAGQLLDPEEIKASLTGNPAIIRAKGYIHIATGWFLLNYTLSGLSLEPCSEKKQSEWVVISKSK